MDMHKETKELLIKTQHIREVTDAVASKLPAHQIKEIEVSLTIKPDFVPDLTKMLAKKDTMVISYTLCLSPREGVSEKIADEDQDVVQAIHNRHAMVADKMPDGSIPVTFITKVSDLETTEYFKQYSETDDVNPENWASKKAAEDIWQFLLRGVKPT